MGSKVMVVYLILLIVIPGTLSIDNCKQVKQGSQICIQCDKNFLLTKDGKCLNTLDNLIDVKSNQTEVNKIIANSGNITVPNQTQNKSTNKNTNETNSVSNSSSSGITKVQNQAQIKLNTTTNKTENNKTLQNTNSLTSTSSLTSGTTGINSPNLNILTANSSVPPSKTAGNLSATNSSSSNISVLNSSVAPVTTTTTSTIVSTTNSSNSNETLVVVIFPNCKQHKNNLCIACEEEYILQQGLCILGIRGCQALRKQSVNLTIECQKCDPHFKLQTGTCKDIHCSQYSQFTNLCFRCKSYYEFNSVKNVCYDSNCIIRKQGLCSECKPGYFLHPDNTFCLIKNSTNCLQYPLKCDICPTKYFLTFQNGCSPLIEGCLSHSANTGECGNCISGLQLIGKKCVNRYCEANNVVCTKCLNGYILNENKICVDQYCINYNQQNCAQCAVGTMKTTSGKCIKLPNQCQALNDAGTSCTKCRQGFSLTNGNCTLNLVVIPNCLKRQSNNSNKCAECLFGYYIDANQRCQPFPYLCTLFNLEKKICEGCRIGSVLVNGSCQDPNCQVTDQKLCSICKQNYKYYSVSRLCTYSDPNCIEFFSNFQCRACKAGYSITQQSNCVKLPQNCFQGNLNTGKCQICKDLYDLKNGSCALKIIITPPNCLTPSKLNPKQCLECQNNYLLINNERCVKKQQPSTICVEYTSDGKCQICVQNYTLKQGICRYPNCNIMLPNVCFQCSAGFNLSLSGYCFRNCKVSMGPICQECNQGYYLSNNSCLLQSKPNCITIQKEQCKACSEGFTLKSGSCQFGFQGCLIYDPFIPECLSCDLNYQLINRYCRDIGCIQFVNNKCIKCQDNQQINNDGICVQKNCFTHDVNKCTLCLEGYILENGRCYLEGCALFNNSDVGKCVTCKNGYYLTQNFKCERSTYLCKQFDNQNRQCLQCRNDILLINNTCQDKNCLSQNKLDCLACSPGYSYNVLAKLCFFNDPNCKQRTNTLVCKQCNEGFYITDDKMCKLLPTGCSAVNQTKCISCLNNFSLNNGQCIINSINNCLIVNSTDRTKCSICQNRYYITNDFKCSLISYLCENFNTQQKVCQKCISGSILTEGSCVDGYCQIPNKQRCQRCLAGYLPNPVTGLCFYNDINCKAFKSNLTCDICLDGFFLNSSKICEKSLENCVRIGLDGKCELCISTHYVSNGICLFKPILPNCLVYNKINPEKCQGCSQNYIVTNLGTCVYFDPNCERLTTSSCQLCKKGYYRQKIGMCYKIPEFCITATDNGNRCVSCLNNYVVNAQGNCIFDGNKVLNCISYSPSNKDKCLECREQFHLSQNNQCIAVSPACFQFNPNTGRCLQCVNTFELLANGSCLSKSTETDPNCFSYYQGACLQCSKRYYVGVEGKCIPINPFCFTYNVMGHCTSCYNTFSLRDKNCVPIGSNDQFCIQIIDENNCGKCYLGYYPQNGKCVQANPLCKVNDNSNACLSCYEGYQLQNGSCKSRFKDVNCKKFDNGICTECVVRYYFNNGKCVQVHPLCNQYNPRTGVCLSCYQGYSLSNNLCQRSEITNPQNQNCRILQGTFCVSCYDRFYSRNGVCVKVNDQCKEYSSLSGSCTACFSGYQLRSTGICQIPSIQQVDPYCKRFVTNAKKQCNQCYSGYQIINDRCVIQNANCAEYNLNSNICARCHTGYILSSLNICTLGSTGVQGGNTYCLKKNNGVCTQCSQGFYLDKNNACQQLNPTCQTHNLINGECTSCFRGFTLTNGSCFSPQTSGIDIPFCQQYNFEKKQCTKCLDRYYLPSSQECRSVSLTCGNYSLVTGRCTSCSSEYYNLQNGECIQLAFIVPGCQIYQGPYCEKCLPGYYYESYNCLKFTERCIQFNYITKVCTTCQSGYKPSGVDCV